MKKATPNKHNPEELFYPEELEEKPDLEQERTLTAKLPTVRLPAKTQLPTVLLASNPWEQRELDKKLDQLQLQRMRKLSSLQWNQRQFFISYLFDGNSNLKYNTDGMNKSKGDKRETSASSTLESSSARPRRRKRAKNERSQTFIDTLQNSNTLQTDTDEVTVVSDANKAQLNGDVNDVALQVPVNEDERASLSRQTCLPVISLPEKDNRNINSSKSDIDSASLPDIKRTSNNYWSLTGPRTAENTCVDSFNATTSHQNLMTSELPKLVTQSHQRETTFSNDNVVDPDNLESISVTDAKQDSNVSTDKHSLYRSYVKLLPTRLMIKANEQASKPINDKKQKLLDRSRRKANRNTLEDPRFQKLQETLKLFSKDQ